MSQVIAKPASARRRLTILDVLRADVDAALYNLSRDDRSGANRRCALGAAIRYLDAALAAVEQLEPYPEARLAVEQTMPLRTPSTLSKRSVSVRPSQKLAGYECLQEAGEFDEFIRGVLAAEPFRWDCAIWNAFQRAARALHLDPAEFSPTRELLVPLC
jgi:hypothetical protein